MLRAATLLGLMHGCPAHMTPHALLVSLWWPIMAQAVVSWVLSNGGKTGLSMVAEEDPSSLT